MAQLVAVIALWLALFVFVAISSVAAMWLFTPLRPLMEHGSFRALWENAARNRGTLTALVVMLVLFFSISSSESLYVGKIGWDVTGAIARIGGTRPIEALQRLESPPLTALLASVYIFGFAFVLGFTPTMMAWLGRDDWLRRYAHTVVWLLFVTMPFFVLFQVTVTSLHDPSVRPLLYSNELLKDFAASGGFHNSFPSSHVYMTAAVALSSATARKEYPRFFAFSCALLALTAFSVLYLGIHWVMDVVAGLALATAVHVFVNSQAYLRLCLRMRGRGLAEKPIN